MMSQDTAIFFRRFAQTIMVFNALALCMGILLKFSYNYLAFFGGMAGGFLLAEVLIVHRAFELIEWRIKHEHH